MISCFMILDLCRFDQDNVTRLTEIQFHYDWELKGMLQSFAANLFQDITDHFKSVEREKHHLQLFEGMRENHPYVD